MRWQLTAGALAGCAAGALLGSYGKCFAGKCLFVSSPFIGGTYGAFMGVMLAWLYLVAFSSDRAEGKLSRNLLSIRKEKTFREQVLKGKGIVFVLFFAEWCGPSSLLMPVVSSISDIYRNRVKVFRFDVEKFPSVKVSQNIKSVPIVVIYKDGVEIERLPGPCPESVYIEKLNKCLSGA